MDSRFGSSLVAAPLVASLVVLSVGCSCGDPAEGMPDGSRDAAYQDATESFDTGPPIPRDAAPFDDCSEDNKKVYVLTTDLGSASAESHLFRFDPATVTYTEIGPVVCAGATGLFHRSMAVDRNGTAWASMNDGSLNAISTTDASCRVTGMETGQEQVQSYGMGFATLGDSTRERLYITATGGWFGPPGEPYRKLGIIDLATETLSLVGDLSAPTPANMELTGTGDGRLFGMVVDVRDLRNLVVSVEELDGETGATLQSRIVPLDASSGFAFAQWGGHFWLFTEAPDGRARVAEFDFEAGVIVQTVDTDLGVSGTIIGAGVSTCAPYNLI